MWKSPSVSQLKIHTEVGGGDGKGANVISAAFDGDGQTVLVVIDQKPYVLLWNVKERKALELSGHKDPVTRAAFSFDGRHIVTVTNIGTVRIWDSRLRGEIDELHGQDKRVLYAAFSPDGRKIVTTSVDHTARLWRTLVSTQDLINFVKSEIPRCLTLVQRRQRFGLSDGQPAWCETLHKWQGVH